MVFCQTTLMELFSEYSWQQKALNYFRYIASSWIISRVLHKPLGGVISFLPHFFCKTFELLSLTLFLCLSLWFTSRMSYTCLILSYLTGLSMYICRIVLAFLLIVAFFLFPSLIKRPGSLSTKTNRLFYGMIKIRDLIIQMLIFLPYMKLYSKTSKPILSIIYQNKTKMPEKSRKCLVYL